MKYCSKCGKELSDDSTFCENCSAPIQQINTVAVKRNSVFGIVSLILSILGFLTGFIMIGIVLDIIAIVFAVIALIQAKKKPINTVLPIAGIIISVLSIILCSAFFLTMSSPEIKSTAPTSTEDTASEKDTEQEVDIEAMLQEAVDTNMMTVYNEYSNNEVRAAQKYVGKPLKITGYVDQISADHFLIHKGKSPSEYYLVFMSVYPHSSMKDKIVELNQNQKVTIVGICEGTTSASIKDAIIIDE